MLAVGIHGDGRQHLRHLLRLMPSRCRKFPPHVHPLKNFLWVQLFFCFSEDRADPFYSPSGTFQSESFPGICIQSIQEYLQNAKLAVFQRVFFMFQVSWAGFSPHS